MSTHIHVSGLSYFCTDDTLRQAFIPFGTVVLAQVLRDEWGHALGLGIVHMACSEDVERVFNEHQRFEVAGSRVDLWEPAEPEAPQTERPEWRRELHGGTKTRDMRRARRRSSPWRCARRRSRPDSGAPSQDRQTLTSPQPSPGTQGRRDSVGGRFPKRIQPSLVPLLRCEIQGVALAA